MLIKVCGITNLEDARHALSAGADWIGLNLVAGPRRIDPATAAKILAGLDDPSRTVVLVCCVEGVIPGPIVDMLRTCGASRVQIYGDRVGKVIGHAASDGFESIIVQPVADDAFVQSLDALMAECGDAHPDYVLLDALVEGRLGGTGRQANWEAIARAHRCGCFDRWPLMLLAGGLTPDNVVAAIRAVGPGGVDVSSGVEASPGRKDRAKIDEFIRAVRGSANESR